MPREDTATGGHRETAPESLRVVDRLRCLSATDKWAVGEDGRSPLQRRTTNITVTEGDLFATQSSDLFELET